MKKFITFITLGCLQCFIGHYFNLHKGLEHMQFDHWVWYLFEVSLYSLVWAGLYYYIKNNNV